jgi:hypothetical protein
MRRFGLTTEAANFRTATPESAADCLKKEKYPSKSNKGRKREIVSEMNSSPMAVHLQHQHQHQHLEHSEFHQSSESFVTSRQILTEIDDDKSKSKLLSPVDFARTFNRLKMIKVRKIPSKKYLSKNNQKSLPASSSSPLALSPSHHVSHHPPSIPNTPNSTVPSSPIQSPVQLPLQTRILTQTTGSPEKLRGIERHVSCPQQQQQHPQEKEDRNPTLSHSQSDSTLASLFESVENNNSKPNIQSTPFENKLMIHWTVDDVCTFLHKIGIPQYQNVCDLLIVIFFFCVCV